MKLLSQNLNINGYDLQGPLDQSSKAGELTTIGSIINLVINTIFPLALVLLFLYLLWAGVDWARSFGNAELIKKSKARMTNALIGVLLLAGSYWMAQLASRIFWPQP